MLREAEAIGAANGINASAVRGPRPTHPSGLDATQRSGAQAPSAGAPACAPACAPARTWSLRLRAQVGVPQQGWSHLAAGVQQGPRSSLRPSRQMPPGEAAFCSTRRPPRAFATSIQCSRGCGCWRRVAIVRAARRLQRSSSSTPPLAQSAARSESVGTSGRIWQDEGGSCSAPQGGEQR